MVLRKKKHNVARQINGHDHRGLQKHVDKNNENYSLFR